MRYLIVCLAGLAVLSLCVFADACSQGGGATQSTSNSNKGGQQQTFADANSAAAQALSTFRTLVNAQNYRDFGFDSADEVASAKLGSPLRVFFVRLDGLRQYQRGGDPNKLLSDIGQLHYPVVSGDKVRSSVVVQQADNRWRLARLGEGGLAQQIASARKSPATATAEAPSDEFIVRVGALGLYFIGRRDGDKLMLTPVAVPPGLNLKRGEATPAEEVFAAILPLAQSQREDAPM